MKAINASGQVSLTDVVAAALFDFAGYLTVLPVIEVERQMLDYHLKKSEAIAEYNTQIAGIEKLISTSVNE
jgi:DTW domain-containing protein YfiP